MPAIAPQTLTDPLAAFVSGGASAAGRHPIPLIATSFDVGIDAGLVTVATLRRFRNTEPESIEATLTFPVPVHGVLFDLQVEIDGRVLKAQARRRETARDDYESAITRGKTAVLHEELLRGVHMLSVGQLAPGAEIAVRATWAATLTCIADTGHFRIPLTVGDIYGRSTLPDSDDLIHGGPATRVSLTVRSRDGAVALAKGRLVEGHAEVPGNAPIDLIVTGWTPRELTGRAADGRQIALRIEPRRAADTPLDVAVLLDRSGSMAESASGASSTKHRAAVHGLKAAAQRIGEHDSIELWEFSHQVRYVGSSRTQTPAPGKSPGQRLVALADLLSPPEGGTEIGGAVHAVLAQTHARDILLITDGKSYALDVQEIARAGRPISVLLVGEDSLEANVGHLAALTGGQIMVASGDDLSTFIQSTLAGLHGATPAAAAPGDRLTAVRGNATIAVEWRGGDSSPSPDRAVAALAASLRLGTLDTEAATSLAEAEGLVTHLTSLILVDEAGATQETLPAARKIALEVPIAMLCSPAAAMPTFNETAAQMPSLNLYDSLRSMGRRLRGRAQRAERFSGPSRAAPAASGDLFAAHEAVSSLSGKIGDRIDWEGARNRLLAGDLSTLDLAVRRDIERLAATPAAALLAAKLKLNAIVLVIGLIARAHASGSRTAARIAQKLLGRQPASELDALAAALGI